MREREGERESERERSVREGECVCESERVNEPTSEKDRERVSECV